MSGGLEETNVGLVEETKENGVKIVGGDSGFVVAEEVRKEPCEGVFKVPG